jgi:hypothetical protein
MPRTECSKKLSACAPVSCTFWALTSLKLGGMRDSLIRVIYLRCGGKLRRSGRPPLPHYVRRKPGNPKAPLIPISALLKRKACSVNAHLRRVLDTGTAGQRKVLTMSQKFRRPRARDRKRQKEPHVQVRVRRPRGDQGGVS